MDQLDQVEFDGWTLNRSSGELQKGGFSVRLRPQPLQVLEELLARPGEVVTRAQLIARLWPKGIVDFDTALNSAVRRLRRSLLDDAETPKYIETIPRKGYRFIGTTVLRNGNSMTLRNPPGYPTAVRPNSAHARALRTVMAIAVFCAAFGLGASGDSPSVYSRLSGPGFSPAALTSPPASASIFVAEGLQKARYFLERRARGDLEIAEEHFEQVLGLDPTRAVAYAGLASVYWLKTVQGAIPTKEGLPKVKALAERALALDPNEVEALQRLALYSLTQGERVKSEQYFRRALELNPDDALVLGIQSSMAFVEERLEESVELSRRAVAAAPLNLVSRYNLASSLYMAGHFDEALKTMQELLQFDAGYRADIMAYILVLNGHHQAALDLAHSWPEGADKSQTLALAHFGLGNLSEADKALEALILQVGDTEPRRIAEVYAYRRSFDQAFGWLRADKKSVSGSNITPPGMLQTIKHSPFIAPLRADPRWRQWLASASATG